MNRWLWVLALGGLVLVGSAVRGETVEGSAAQPVLVEAGEDVPPLPKVRALTHRAAVLGVSFSPDGATLASASSDNTVRLWDLESGDCRWELRGLRDDGWIARRADGKLFRGDDGTVLAVRSSYRDAYEPLAPCSVAWPSSNSSTATPSASTSSGPPNTCEPCWSANFL